MSKHKKTSSGLSQQRLSNHKNNQKSILKHSRKPTTQITSNLNIQDIMIGRYKRSKRQMENQQLIALVDSVVQGNSQGQGLTTRELLTLSEEMQYLFRYYTLTNFIDCQNSQSIQVNLPRVIQEHHQIQSYKVVLPHYGREIYPIVRRYSELVKKFHRKQQHQGISTINRYINGYTKDLPTLVTMKDHSKTGKFAPGQNSPNRDCHSQSYELKALADCIKVMFQKQHQFRTQISSNKLSPNWLREKEDKPLMMDWQQSSIEMDQKFQFMVDSKLRGSTESQEMYGLGEIRRRCQEKQGHLKEKLRKGKLGHKRNPTDTLHSKQQNYYDPLTPKEKPGRSAFGSFKNIPLESDRKGSKSKDPYLLKFIKVKKQRKTQHCKENNVKENNVRSPKVELKSKSKSRDKLKFRSPQLKRQ